MITLRLVLVLLSLACLAAAGAAESASAWVWPVGGPVLRAFELGDDPYAGGQHRGVDIGAVVGEDVLAPAAGRVAFAGSVPGSGRTVTIETPYGLSVTLVHLGAYTVHRDEAVLEGAVVGHAGENTGGEWQRAYVHLGVRRSSDPHGYLDPLTLLPPRGGVAPQPLPEPPAVEAPAPAPVPSPVAASAEPAPVPEPPAVEAPAPLPAGGVAEPVPLPQPAAAPVPKSVPTPAPASPVAAEPAPAPPPVQESPAPPVGSASGAEHAAPAVPAAEAAPVAGVPSSRSGARPAPASRTPEPERSGGLPAAAGAAPAPALTVGTTPPEMASDTPASSADVTPTPTVASPAEASGRATPAVPAVAEAVSAEPTGGADPTSSVVAPVAASRSVPLFRPGLRPASQAGPRVPQRIARRIERQRAHASVALDPVPARAGVHSALSVARPRRWHSRMRVHTPQYVLPHGRMVSGTPATVRPLAGPAERPSRDLLLAALWGGAAAALTVLSVALRRRPRTRAAIPTREPARPSAEASLTEPCRSRPARAPRSPECRRGSHADPLAELLRPPRRRPAPSPPFRGRSGRSLNRLHGRRGSVRVSA